MRWIWDWSKYQNSSKSIRVTRLFFGQKDLPRSTPFLQKNSLVTLILFELLLLWYLAQSQIHRITLYEHLNRPEFSETINFWFSHIFLSSEKLSNFAELQFLINKINQDANLSKLLMSVNVRISPSSFLPKF